MFSEEEQQQETADGFFTNLENTKPFLKMGFEGFAGSGKSRTMALTAIGLHKYSGSQKPVVVFDTEKAAKFLLPLFKEAGIKTLHKESRSLADLVETMKRVEDGAGDILLIDSLTHVWENFIEAYKTRKKRTRVEFQDWGFINPAWKREFSEVYVRGRFHASFTGRAGFQYSDEVNEETGKREIFKSGIKMKVENETAYEPDLLVLMSRCEDVVGTEKGVWREATVLKDRSALIDGKTFRNPGFEEFRPAIEQMLRDGVMDHGAPERDAADLIQSEDDRREWVKHKTIALEEIQGYLVSVYPGQTAIEKRSKSDAIAHAFGTRSWEAVEGKSIGELQAGLLRIQQFAEQQKAETAS